MTSMEDLTASQMEALVAMRSEFNEQNGTGMPLNDSTYIRYLRARNFDTGKSTAMLRATIAWRKEFDLGGLQTTWKESIEYENATGKLYVRGYDKEGRALIYMKPAHENSKNHDGNLKHLVYNLERAIACMEATSGQGKWVLLIDYDGFTMTKSPPMHTCQAVLQILQDHYPERLYRAYVVRPPYLFYALLQFLSPFMDALTRSKAVMLTDAQLASPDNQLITEISADRLEFKMSGMKDGADHRPFSSQLYLTGPFDKEFRRLLIEEEEGKGEEGEGREGREGKGKQQDKKEPVKGREGLQWYHMAVLPRLCQWQNPRMCMSLPKIKTLTCSTAGSPSGFCTCPYLFSSLLLLPLAMPLRMIRLRSSRSHLHTNGLRSALAGCLVLSACVCSGVDFNLGEQERYSGRHQTGR